MTKLLAKVFEAAQKLPPQTQDAFAKAWLAEVDAEMRWEETFDETAEALSQLGQQALEEDRAGKTAPLDPDEL